MELRILQQYDAANWGANWPRDCISAVHHGQQDASLPEQGYTHMQATQNATCRHAWVQHGTEIAEVTALTPAWVGHARGERWRTGQLVRTRQLQIYIERSGYVCHLGRCEPHPQVLVANPLVPAVALAFTGQVSGTPRNLRNTVAKLQLSSLVTFPERRVAWQAGWSTLTNNPTGVPGTSLAC